MPITGIALLLLLFLLNEVGSDRTAAQFLEWLLDGGEKRG
jgi:hypothetical protein